MVVKYSVGETSLSFTGFKENFNFLLTIPFLSPGIPRRKIEPFERQRNVSVLI